MVLGEGTESEGLGTTVTGLPTVTRKAILQSSVSSSSRSLTMPQLALPRMLSPRNQSLVTWSREWESDIDTTGTSPA